MKSRKVRDQEDKVVKDILPLCRFSVSAPTPQSTEAAAPSAAAEGWGLLKKEAPEEVLRRR